MLWLVYYIAAFEAKEAWLVAEKGKAAVENLHAAGVVAVEKAKAAAVVASQKVNAEAVRLRVRRSTALIPT